MLADLRYALRTLRRSPGYAAAAVLTLALGIGANTAIFTVVRTVLLAPLPYREPDRLAWVWATRVDRDRAFFSIPNFLDTREAALSFEKLAAFTPWAPTLSGDGEPERLDAVRVNGDVFDVLGARAALGRPLAHSDSEPQAARVAVISHGLWTRRFGGDPSAVGRSLLLNGEAYAVVGVLPAGFVFPGAETADAIVPLSLAADPRRTERGSNFLRTFGRLRPGADAVSAARELASVTDRLRRQYPDENAKLTAPRVLAISDEILGGSRRLLLVLSAAVALLVLVACANLASLALVRGFGRRREVAVRKALGARTGRIVRPFVAEALVLSACGAAAALTVAQQAVPLLIAAAPAGIPRASSASIDAAVLAYTAAVAIACALACAIGPALLAARAPAAGGLAERGAGERPPRARAAFVLAQVAVSVVLLSGAGLLAKSFARLADVDPGFAARRALALRITLNRSSYPDRAAAALFYRRAISRLAALPGVESAAAGNVLPLSGINVRNDFRVAGRPVVDRAETPGAQTRWVDGAWFRTLGIPVRSGRAFTDADDSRAPLVAILDETLAKRVFPSGDALGSRLVLEDAELNPRIAEIVGVVGDVKHFALEEEPSGTLYLPIAQVPNNMLSNLLNNSSLVVLTAADPGLSVPTVRRAVREVDADVPTGAVTTLAEIRGSAIAARRFTAAIFALFAAAAAALAAVGLYGALSQMVAQDRRAIGIRLALGASPGDIVRRVARRGVGLALAGTSAGIAGALALSRLLAASLYSVSPTDPTAYAAAAGLLALLALAASALPARRAARVDPAVVLRSE
jgi:putative ABC transport system permease protein